MIYMVYSIAFKDYTNFQWVYCLRPECFRLLFGFSMLSNSSIISNISNISGILDFSNNKNNILK